MKLRNGSTYKKYTALSFIYKKYPALSFIYKKYPALSFIYKNTLLSPAVKSRGPSRVPWMWATKRVKTETGI